MMSTVKERFVQVVADILSRYLRQNDQPAAARVELVGVGERLWHQIEARGLPPPLAKTELGAPGELSPSEIAAMMEPILHAMTERSRLEVPLQQVVKACFYPPFRKCRETYRERAPDGICRRQQLERARTRVSGSHCVDCPYWTALTPVQHTAVLSRGWAGDVAEFTTHVAVFLPEDFRLFRELLADAARRQQVKS
jgi:hypothetical protein